MPEIQIQRLQKSFGEKKVLQDLTLTLSQGEVYCLMGPSGCGKTTLMRILLGLEKADGGTVTGMPARPAVVFQEDRLIEEYTVLANIRLVTGKKKKEPEIETCLQQLGLAEDIHTPVHVLSGGMKRRVALARALLAESDCILLDEPFKGLDAGTKEQAMKTLLRYRAGKTVIFITHDRTEAESLGGKIIEKDLSV